MTILRRYLGLGSMAAGAVLGTCGCSSDSEPPPAAPSSGDDSKLLGTFKIEVIADDSGPTTGATSVLGKVSDGETPLIVAWQESAREGSCRLEKPRVPFCSPACGADVCVEDNVCRAYPTPLSVGTVTLSGVKLNNGESSLTLKEAAKAYQAPPGTAFAYPPFAEGEAVRLSASGGELAPFELSAVGVSPLWLDDQSLDLEAGKPLDLHWAPPADGVASSIHVKLDISHHGGSKGMIECDADDTGALSIPAALLSQLLDLGVAGFPTVIVTRTVSDRKGTGAGTVALVIASSTERAVTVPGVNSCTGNEQCPSGQTCQADLTCQ
jgi:hypothetical protein